MSSALPSSTAFLAAFGSLLLLYLGINFASIVYDRTDRSGAWTILATLLLWAGIVQYISLHYRIVSALLITFIATGVVAGLIIVPYVLFTNLYREWAAIYASYRDSEA